MTDEFLRSRRRAYFILESQKNEADEYRALFCLENVPHYYTTHYLWGKQKEKAQKLADLYNQILGLDPEAAMDIIGSSVMGKPC